MKINISLDYWIYTVIVKKSLIRNQYLTNLQEIVPREPWRPL